MNKKYSNFLTIILILIIVAIVAIIGFLGFKYYQTYTSKSEAEDFVDAWGKDQHNNKNPNKNEGSVIPPNDDDDDDNIFDGIEDGKNPNDSIGTGGNTQKFNGFEVAGTIEIPATKLKCPVLAPSDKSSAIETSVVQIYGPGLNQIGNTTIYGHNYRNGTFFSNNKKLKVGDKIYITDLQGKRLTYTIYDKFEAKDNYADYMTRDTQGAIEISLSTCTDDSKARIIILAKADV